MRVSVQVVDSEKSTRVALCRLLRSSGIRATEYVSVCKLLSDDSVARPGCVLLDGDTAGFDWPDRVRQLLAVHRPAPLILFGVHDSESDRSAAKRLGVAAFLSKPVDGQALIDTIQWIVASEEQDC